MDMLVLISLSTHHCKRVNARAVICYALVCIVNLTPYAY